MSRSNVWHSATLVADARARNLGKEWLTQQLYHNIHEPFTLLPAVSYDDQDDFVQFDFQASDQPFTCIEQMQYTWPGTVQMFRRLVESNMQAVIFHNHVEMASSFINWLQGHFVEANRFILVMRQVEHDEAHVCDPVQKHQHYMSWYCVVSPTHILLRFVSHISHLFRGNDGFVSVDEIAAVRDIDITGIQDEDHKVAYVRREVFRRGKADLLSWRQHFMDLMHQTAIN
ncbi:hypothetical protein DYB25_000300 [Aphanomyces astaci]|uniref:Uncharacterized protein n=1 Tax=Aphanomyces astaci TaxID=112090 RepID=A0A397A0E8_APHAT|nr:hypothetical protein DYB36_005760 [Aphanomyces astaci]RHY07177.1 hypothetical protein DYB25_000300 [Aphanomyces astaci]RHY63385.1 hypothetical protein DYB30_001156 [Aphanomyces astaci]